MYAIDDSLKLKLSRIGSSTLYLVFFSYFIGGEKLATDFESKAHMAFPDFGKLSLEHLHWFSPSAKGTAIPSAFIILMTHWSTSNQESLQGLPKYKP
jgi:hypothetical protein